MEDCEIRDALRRATTPDLFVTLTLGEIPRFVEYNPNTEISKPITLRVLVGNRSPQPAFHTIVLIDLEAALRIANPSPFTQTVRGHGRARLVSLNACVRLQPDPRPQSKPS
jgi:hypothetical protein